MNDMPAIWLWISGAFFVMGIVFFIVVLSMLIHLQKALGETLPAIKNSVERLEKVTEQLEKTTASAQRTVDHVGNKARNVADGIEAVAMLSAQRIQMFSTILTATSTVFKLMQMVKSSKADKAKVDKLPAKRDNKGSRRGVEQSGSSSGS